MPTSKKPRKPKGKPAAPRKSTVEMMFDELTSAMVSGDLDLFDYLLAELRKHAGRDPSLDAEFFAHVGVMRAELAGSIAIADDVNAALWVGDMKRVQQLEEANLPLSAPDAQRDLDDEDDAEVDRYFNEPDHYADLAAGKPGALDALLATGIKLETFAGPDDRPALFAAVEAPGRSAETLQRLIAAGADPTDELDSGHTIIAWALMYDHYDTVTPASEKAVFDLLFAEGASISGETDDFGPDLIAAIILAGVPQVAALLDAAADISVTAPEDFELPLLDGATVLMLAAPKPDVVRLLLDKGANPAIRDENGRTPLEFVSDAAAVARANAKDDWGRAHADALDQSQALIRAALQ